MAARPVEPQPKPKPEASEIAPYISYVPFLDIDCPLVDDVLDLIVVHVEAHAILQPQLLGTGLLHPPTRVAGGLGLLVLRNKRR